MNVRVTIGNPIARRSIEDAIERLLAMLDQMDADPDYEPDNDDEPSLGWPDQRGPSQLDTRMQLGDDRDGWSGWPGYSWRDGARPPAQGIHFRREAAAGCREL